ncbi:MAG: YbjQ family protein [Rhodanobacteraceae bacterium]
MAVLVRSECRALKASQDFNETAIREDRRKMIIVTSENVAGYRITETKGQVFGLVVRSRGIGGNVMAGLRSIVGGEISEYTQMLEEARRHATDRMVQNAQAMGANAVVMMRFDSSEIGQTMSEIVAYGTAVVIEKG